jgi:outer membrane biosynthesis protein TonB
MSAREGRKWWSSPGGRAFALAGMLAACGGAQSGANQSGTAGAAGSGESETATAEEPDQEEGGGGDDGLIPPEKLDEIKAQFDRKRDLVSRCYPQAIEAGELAKDAKGYVTVGVTIQPDGSARAVKVLEATLASQKLTSCVLDHVKRWTFTTLPRPLDYSYTYSFEAF